MYLVFPQYIVPVAGLLPVFSAGTFFISCMTTSKTYIFPNLE